MLPGPLPPGTHSRIRLKTPPPLASPAIALPPPPEVSEGNGLAVISPHKRQRKHYTTRAPGPLRKTRVKRNKQSTSKLEIVRDDTLEERDVGDGSMEDLFGVDDWNSDLMGTTERMGQKSLYTSVPFHDFAVLWDRCQPWRS